MKPRPFRPLLAAGILLLAGLSGAIAAGSDGASSWDRTSHAAVRLIAAPGQGATLEAGIEIALAPGWKTYWRYPGDSGIPPRFDFTASRNLEAFHVQWPAPVRFPDGAGYAIGYIGNVVLPILVRRSDERAPAHVDLKLDYAVCEKICVPLTAHLRLDVPARTDAHAQPLRAALARVPQRVALGAPGPLRVVSVRREEGARVVVDVASDGVVDLFAEGPTPEWSLPLPAPVGHPEPGLTRFAFDLDGAPAGAATDSVKLTLTAVSPAHAIELTATLD